MKGVSEKTIMNEVAAVVVTYNRRSLLGKCIEKLQKQTVPLDILVIDNASTDGTNELFESAPDNVKYFNTGKNLGGAGGFNYGMKKAVESGYKYLWILDDDTMPTATALKAFLDKDEELRGEYGFLSSKVLWKNDAICSMNVQKNTKWRQIKNFNEEQMIQYASFVSLFLKADVVRKIGLPYKDFFIWADDWEYTRRISKQGKCYYIPSSIVHHWCDSNVGANIVAADESRISRFNYMYRNDVVLYRQDGIEGTIYLIIRNLLHKVRILKSEKNVKEKMDLIRNATKEGKRFYPKVEFPEK